jgi:hypothetical protein
MGLKENGAAARRPFRSTAMIALVVPLTLLVVAIRRNSGIFAAFLLLMLFAARM